ncbi:MAG: acyl-ACP--UDP-N-acetylglucosamine O-acyltransferase [Phycisphaerales bacterium]
MPTIHPSSVVEPGATLAEDAVVGPFCRVGPRSTLGPGTKLVSHVCVLGRTTLGTGNTVWPFATLGADPQDLKFKGEDSELVIGDHNDIRENVTIHKGTKNDEGVTRVGDHNLIMAYAHLGHDCVVGSHTIISNAVQFAGHVHLADHAIVGGATACHHFVTIGQYAYVGGMTCISLGRPASFMIAEGNPSRCGVNAIGLKRHGFSPDDGARLKHAWKLFKMPSENEGAASSTALDSNRLLHRRLDGQRSPSTPSAVPPKAPTADTARVCGKTTDSPTRSGK